MEVYDVNKSCIQWIACLSFPHITATHTNRFHMLKFANKIYIPRKLCFAYFILETQFLFFVYFLPLPCLLPAGWLLPVRLLLRGVGARAFSFAREGRLWDRACFFFAGSTSSFTVSISPKRCLKRQSRDWFWIVQHSSRHGNRRRHISWTLPFVQYILEYVPQLVANCECHS